MPNRSGRPVEMEYTEGVSVSWQLEGDEIVAESNIPLDDEGFYAMFPAWTLPKQAKSILIKVRPNA